jgi:hypothetical protein
LGDATNWGNKLAPLSKTRGILTDPHFWIPVAAFCFGLALLIALH